MTVSLEQLLTRARARLDRLSPRAAADAAAHGAVLVDILGRPPDRRRRDDPRRSSDPRATCSSGGWPPTAIIAIPKPPDPSSTSCWSCNEGYQSSLAAATLQELGFTRATDLDGGFCAWRDAGLPVDPA